MSSKDKRHLQGRVNSAQLSSLLEQAIPALKSGELNINWAGENIRFRPGEDIALSMQVSRKKEKEKLTLELSWSVADPSTSKE